MVFSSSAATFGTPDVDLVTEETETRPESPYGESKLIGEWLIRDQARATGLRHTSLRYFNVVGSGADDLYDTSPHNLFPIVFEKLLAGETPRINGDDYDTPDGTCVRDYVHVADLADLPRRRPPSASPPASELQPVYNLGSGTGCSVARDHGRDPHGHRHRLHPRRSARAGRATRPASSRPARPPRATSTGRCATTSRTWCARPGRPAAATRERLP